MGKLTLQRLINLVFYGKTDFANYGETDISKLINLEDVNQINLWDLNSWCPVKLNQFFFYCKVIFDILVHSKSPEQKPFNTFY